MGQTLILYDDAFRLVWDFRPDNENDIFHDYQFSEVSQIYFIYKPSRLTKNGRQKALRILLIILTLGIGVYFGVGDISVSTSDTAEFHIKLKDGKEIIHEQEFSSKKEADKFEKKLLTLVKNSSKVKQADNQ